MQHTHFAAFTRTSCFLALVCMARRCAHGLLQGDLALLATGGGGGVPTGHITAWKADHKLHLKFLRALAAKIK